MLDGYSRRMESRATTSWRTALLMAPIMVMVGCSVEGDTSDAMADPAVSEVGVLQQSDPSEDGPTTGVTVIGVGDVSVTPDTARISVGVEVERPDVLSAFEAANDAADDVLAALGESGVAEEDLQTSELSIREQRDRPPEGPTDGVPEVSGYVVTNLVEVTARDVGNIGTLIGAAVDAGGDAVRIQGIDFFVEDAAAARENARASAFADAEQRAMQYADLAARSLGELVSLSEVVGSSGPGPVLEAADAAAGAPVEPGQQEITVQLQATWSLD